MFANNSPSQKMIKSRVFQATAPQSTCLETMMLKRGKLTNLAKSTFTLTNGYV
jgi:hypothetical protein